MSLCAFERVEGRVGQEVLLESNFSFPRPVGKNHSRCPPWWIALIYFQCFVDSKEIVNILKTSVVLDILHSPLKFSVFKTNNKLYIYNAICIDFEHQKIMLAS